MFLKKIGRLFFLFFLTLFIFISCKSAIRKDYKVYIAAVENKTNWPQISSELYNYLHTFFRKFTTVSSSRESADTTIFVSVEEVNLYTDISGRFDTPLFSHISASVSLQLIDKKTKYNASIYEEVPYIIGQNESVDYALLRLYDKIATGIYFHLVKNLRK
jgi:hypothetical protein